MMNIEKYKRSMDMIQSCVLPEQIDTATIYLKMLWGDSWNIISPVYKLEPKTLVTQVRRELDKRIDFINSEVRKIDRD